MDEIFLETNVQIYKTLELAAAMLRHVNISAILFSFALLYVLMLRKWHFEKLVSFLVILFLLFIAFVRIEFYLTTVFGASEDGSLIFGLERTMMAIVAGVIFLYHAAIK